MTFEDKQNLIGSFILFNDKKTKIKPDTKTEYNQVGVFISNKDILFLRNRKIRKIGIEDLVNSKVFICKHTNPELTQKIASFFFQLN